MSARRSPEVYCCATAGDRSKSLRASKRTQPAGARATKLPSAPVSKVRRSVGPPGASVAAHSTLAPATGCPALSTTRPSIVIGSSTVIVRSMVSPGASALTWATPWTRPLLARTFRLPGTERSSKRPPASATVDRPIAASRSARSAASTSILTVAPSIAAPRVSTTLPRTIEVGCTSRSRTVSAVGSRASGYPTARSVRAWTFHRIAEATRIVYRPEPSEIAVFSPSSLMNATSASATGVPPGARRTVPETVTGGPPPRMRRPSLLDRAGSARPGLPGSVAAAPLAQGSAPVAADGFDVLPPPRPRATSTAPTRAARAIATMKRRARDGDAKGRLEGKLGRPGRAASNAMVASYYGRPGSTSNR